MVYCRVFCLSNELKTMRIQYSRNTATGSTNEEKSEIPWGVTQEIERSAQPRKP